ncbi:glycosyltransferase family 1 protein [Naasia sp. SYSU D00948]|uniref:glycosyltransferase family 4 protein n=1 Tax=Naasia sp. SYSU D00948 TaxID=2817379 RepID=UPI001B30953D|nr:glycosyltransferase family 1 protein [Naasia sp. SYSU D00948]
MSATGSAPVDAGAARSGRAFRGVVLNGAFRAQRLTGQQRYATELAARLRERVAASGEGVREIGPPPSWRTSRWLSWLWVLTAGLRTRSAEALVTLTSRGPLVAPRHVVVVHDLFVLEHPEWYSRLYAWTHAPVLRLQLRSAAALVAVSEPVARQVADVVGGDRPVLVAPNAAADCFRVDGESVGVLERFGLTEGRFLLAVGSADPRKGEDVLLEAYHRLEPSLRERIPLVLAGGGSDIFRRAGGVAPAGSGVRRLGYVSDPELAALYRSAALVVFPTLAEGFGLPAVEAIASGARLLTSDLEVLRWVCGDLATYFRPGDATSLAAELDALLPAGPLPAADRAARAAEIRRRFDWDSSAAVVQEAARAALGARQGALR